jgi:putative dimethyl sulfoxide reductase chaperone
VIVSLEARSELYWWLSAAFYVPEESLVAPDFVELGKKAADQLWPGCDVFEPLLGVDSVSAQDRLLQLQREYVRLFVGPSRAAVRPYESCYFGTDQLMTERTLAVQACYEEAGIAMDACAEIEPPDHVAIELTYLAMVCVGDTGHAEKERAEMEQRFLDGHARQWMPAFCEQVLASTQVPFYIVSARLLQQLLA